MVAAVLERESEKERERDGKTEKDREMEIDRTGDRKKDSPDISK